MTIIDTRRPELEPIPPPPHPAVGPVIEGQRFSLRRVSVHGWITAAIGLLTTVLYTWNLSINGYGNDYYAAAVRSASVDWKAFFFGSIDPGNFITVDKPPLALWVQALSARIFGFSSWSMLLPEALAGVASVLLLHRLVRRWSGDVAAHIAALAFALTPVAVLMFRFNNPDAILTFLCVAAASALWTALETGRTRWLVLSAALIGMAFEAKMLQAFVVLPAFILVYLVAGTPTFWRRIGQLAAALGTLIVSAGWWIAVVALWPADSRPYIGSTSDNSIVSLLFGYNGLGRIFGEGGGAGGTGGGAGAGSNFAGPVGWTRMFNAINGGQISWLIPMALIGLVAGLWLTRRAPRTDLGRAGWLLWGGWTVVMLTVFSRAQGIFHPYYEIQLAPGVAALAGAGGVALWRLGRTNRWLRWALPAAIIVSAGWAVALLDRTPTYVPWLSTFIIGAALLAVVGLWVGQVLRRKLVVAVAAGLAVTALLAGPAAYSSTTVRTAATGSIVSAGPSTGSTGGRGSSTTDQTLIDYLEANRGDATYLVATFGSQSSAAIIIATGEPVITIGGFNGGDPAPTLDQFKALVASGQVRYLLVSGGGGAGGPGGGAGGPGGGSTTSSISTWAAQAGTTVEEGGTATLYDLSGAA